MTAIRGGLDMRGKASFLYRLWKDHSGATPIESVITLVIFGAVLTGAMILVEDSISLVIDNL